MKTLGKALAGFLLGALGMAGGVVFAANVASFTNPGIGPNSVNFPAAMTDLNLLVNNINSALAPLGLGQINTAQTSFGPSGRVYSQVGPTTSLATTVAGVTIATYTIPANSFDVAGRTLRVHVEFHDSAAADSRSYECGVGANVVTKTVTTDISSAGTCDIVVTEGVTANTQMFSGRSILGTTPTIATLAGTTANSLTTAASNTAYFAVADPTAAGDVILDNFEVFYDN